MSISERKGKGRYRQRLYDRVDEIGDESKVGKGMQERLRTTKIHGATQRTGD